MRVNAERVQFLDRRDDGRGGMPGEFSDAPPQQGGYNQANNYQQNRGMRQDYAPRQQQYRNAPQGGNGAPAVYDEPPSMPSDDAQYVPVDGVEDDIPF